MISLYLNYDFQASLVVSSWSNLPRQYHTPKTWHQIWRPRAYASLIHQLRMDVLIQQNRQHHAGDSA